MPGKHVLKAFFINESCRGIRQVKNINVTYTCFLYFDGKLKQSKKKYTRVLIDPAGVLTFMFNALSDTAVNKYDDSTEAMLSSRFISTMQLDLFHAFHEAAKASEKGWL